MKIFQTIPMVVLILWSTSILTQEPVSILKKQAAPGEMKQKVRFNDQPEIREFKKYHTKAGFQSGQEHEIARREYAQEMAQQPWEGQYTPEKAHQKARQLAEELRMEEFRAKEGNKPLTQAEFEEWKKGRLLAEERRRAELREKEGIRSLERKIDAIQQELITLKSSSEDFKEIQEDVMERLEQQKDIPYYVATQLGALYIRALKKIMNPDVLEDERNKFLADIRIAALTLAMGGLLVIKHDESLKELKYVDSIDNGLKKIQQLPGMAASFEAQQRNEAMKKQQQENVLKSIEASAANRRQTGGQSFDAYRQQLVEQQMNEAARRRAGEQQGQQQENVLKSIEASAANRRQTGGQSFDAYRQQLVEQQMNEAARRRAGEEYQRNEAYRRNIVEGMNAAARRKAAAYPIQK